MGEETEPTTVAEGVTADEPSREHHRKRKKLLHKSLLELMEFYLGDVNLNHDKFLRDRIHGKPFVDVDLSIFLSFNRVKALTSDITDLAKAIQHSDILQLSEDKTKVCRITPILKKENEDDCTIYVEQLGPDVDHDLLNKVFSEFGPVDYISIPRYSHNGKFKGFAFVEFKDPECAKRALEVLSSKGCCLSPQMAPEHLASVRTFDAKENKNNVMSKKNDGSDQNMEGSGFKEHSNKTKSKRKHSEEGIKQPSSKGVEQCDEEEEGSHRKKIKTEQCDQEEEGPNKKKIKTEQAGETNAEASQPESEEENDAKNKKRKLSHENKSRSNINSDMEDESQPATKKAKSDTEDVLETEEASHTEEEGVENPTKQHKKRKRKKKIKKDKVTASSLGLKVLSKKEWKQLRNKYLNMQKEVMGRLKQQLYRPRTELGRPRTQADDCLKPGTVIKVTLDEPVTNTKTTRSELRIHPEICYVDASEGSLYVYLRTTSPDITTLLVQGKHWPNMEILQGDEESAYWEKMKKDRQDHFFQKRSKPNQRGRTKLLKRAEKFQEKQM